jgi:hypothetical protein
MFSAAVVAGSGSRRRQALGRVVFGVSSSASSVVVPGIAGSSKATVDPGLLAKARDRGEAAAFIAAGRAPRAGVRPSPGDDGVSAVPIHSWPAHPSASSPPHENSTRTFVFARDREPSTGSSWSFLVDELVTVPWAMTLPVVAPTTRTVIAPGLHESSKQRMRSLMTPTGAERLAVWLSSGQTPGMSNGMSLPQEARSNVKRAKRGQLITAGRTAPRGQPESGLRAEHSRPRAGVIVWGAHSRCAPCGRRHDNAGAPRTRDDRRTATHRDGPRSWHHPAPGAGSPTSSRLVRHHGRRAAPDRELRDVSRGQRAAGE